MITVSEYQYKRNLEDMSNNELYLHCKEVLLYCEKNSNTDWMTLACYDESKKRSIDVYGNAIQEYLKK